MEESVQLMIKDKRGRSLPPHIATPRKGPLLLQKLSSSKSLATQSCSNQKRHYVHPHKKTNIHGLLTRYPVRLSPQPMDVIESHLLNGLTWSQLKHNIQLMDVSGQ